MAQLVKQFDNTRRQKLATIYEAAILSMQLYKVCNDRAQIHCCLLIRKSRVTPLKLILIPRLELTAAALSVKTSKMLGEELDVHVDDETFWTESLVVSGYINSDVRRLKVFVANRVQQICDHTSTKQWQFIENGNNTADDASSTLDSKM